MNSRILEGRSNRLEIGRDDEEKRRKSYRLALGFRSIDEGKIGEPCTTRDVKRFRHHAEPWSAHLMTRCITNSDSALLACAGPVYTPAALVERQTFECAVTTIW